MRPTNDTILALDPGLRELGYAVVRGHRLVASGVLGLRRVPKAQRLSTARHPLPWLNELHQISRSARNLATRQHATFTMYSPQTVRASVAGNGKAKKPEVAVAVAHHFPALRMYLTQDRRWKERHWQNMFDAIALALHHQSAAHPPSRSRYSG
jgi:Holliday junction resolvasome RuvABC endonuclease subunit